jgi:hypothetical protein
MNNIKPKIIGVFGVIAGFVALLAVLVGPSICDTLYPKPPVEERIADKAVAIRDAVKSRLKGEPRQSPPLSERFDPHELPYTISLTLAAVGIIGGCVSYLRREDHRFAYVACGVGTLTLAWHAVLMALGALVLCIIIFGIISVFTGGGG